MIVTLVYAVLFIIRKLVTSFGTPFKAVELKVIAYQFQDTRTTSVVLVLVVKLLC